MLPKLIIQSTDFILNAQFGGVQAPGNTGRFGSISGFMTGSVGIINTAINWAALIAVALLVYSSVMMIVANGEAEKIERATQGIWASLVGLIFVFIAAMIVRYVWGSAAGF